MGAVSRMPVQGSRRRQADPATHAVGRVSPPRADPDDAPRGPQGPSGRGRGRIIIAGAMIAIIVILVLLYVVIPPPYARTGPENDSMEILRYLFGR
jgi:hypothetical protein